MLDTNQYPIENFNDLYHHRWPIEEDYKTMKCRVELENFTGKSALSVYQDFHAKVFAKSLVWIMAFSVQNCLDQESSPKLHRYQINFTQAFLKSKGVMALLFHETIRRIRRLIADLQYKFQRTVEPIRQEENIREITKLSRENSFLSTNRSVKLMTLVSK